MTVSSRSWLRRCVLGGAAVLWVGCGSSSYAQKDDVDSLKKDMREQRERQLAMERRLADMDTRMALLAERLSQQKTASPQGSGGNRPALGVVRLAPPDDNRRSAHARQPRAEPADEDAPEIVIDGQRIDPSGDLQLPVDRQVLADNSKARQPQVLAAQEEEVLARTDPRTQYNLAMRHFKGRQYAEAVRGFEEVADRWPDHPLADNAVYWTGVCYLQQNEMALAINELQKVPVRYPKSDKVPDALLQLAEAYQRVGDKESAKAMLTQVVEMFPSAEAAGPARDNLAKLNKE